MPSPRRPRRPRNDPVRPRDPVAAPGRRRVRPRVVRARGAPRPRPPSPRAQAAARAGPCAGVYAQPLDHSGAAAYAAGSGAQASSKWSWKIRTPCHGRGLIPWSAVSRPRAPGSSPRVSRPRLPTLRSAPDTMSRRAVPESPTSTARTPMARRFLTRMLSRPSGATSRAGRATASRGSCRYISTPWQHTVSNSSPHKERDSKPALTSRTRSANSGRAARRSAAAASMAAAGSAPVTWWPTAARRSVIPPFPQPTSSIRFDCREDMVGRRKRGQNPCLVGAQLVRLRAGHGGALLGKDLRQPLLGWVLPPCPCPE
jgi:hypothetical protein